MPPVASRTCFGGAGGDAPAGLDIRPAKAWTQIQRLEKEFDAIGFYLSGHPLDEYDSVLESMGVQTFAAFEAGVEQGRLGGRIAAIVVSARERKSRQGQCVRLCDVLRYDRTVRSGDLLRYAQRQPAVAGTGNASGWSASRPSTTVKR